MVNKNSKLFFILTFAFALLLQLSLEFTFRLELSSVFTWIPQSIPAFVLSYLTVLCFSLFFVCATGNVYMGYSISALILFVLSIVNYLKYASLATVFVPYDIFKADLAGKFVADLSYKLPPAMWIYLGMWVILLFACYMLTPPLKVSVGVRVGMFALSALFMLFILTASSFKLLVLDNIGIKTNMLNPDYTYNQNGFALGFALSMRSALIKKPDNYDEILQTFMSYVEDTEQFDADDAPENIIFYLSESFWDPMLLEGLYSNVDPLQNYRKYAEKFPSGDLIAPSFGGATINVEFEVLTGLTTNSLPRGSYPFLQYMDKGMYSVAQSLRRNGYRTIGVHTYNKWFYNRDTVYPLLGFDEFYGLEDTKKYDISGGYLSDELLTWMILDLVNDVTGEDSSVDAPVDKQKRPKFIFAISMENHLPYKADKYDKYDVNIKSDYLDDEQTATLQSYVQGTYKADQALGMLIEGLSKTKDKTLLVFFGDHLPPFNNQEIYLQHNFISQQQQLNWNGGERYKMHKTPLLIWANYPIENDEVKIGASFLSSYVMTNYIGIKDDEFFNVNNTINQLYFTAINNQIVVDVEGTVAASVPARLQDAANFYNSIVYDQLFGSNKILRELGYK